MNRSTMRHFWEWFAGNQDKYLKAMELSKKEVSFLFKEMEAHLMALSRYFSYNIFWPNSGKARLTISVNGKKKHFQKVDKFIASAPEIPGWEFRALELPLPIDMQLDKLIKKTGIHPTELMFYISDDSPEGKHINVCHSMVTEENEKDILDMAYQAAYNLLGERVYATEVYRIDVINRSHVTYEGEIYPLEQIPEFIGPSKSEMMIDENGNLVQGVRLI